MLYMRYRIIILLLLIKHTGSWAQSRIIKKETRIIYDYSYINWGGKTIIDTLVIEYYPDGKRKTLREDHIISGKTTYLDSVKTVVKTKDLIHVQEYWSDTTIHDAYTRLWADSMQKLTIRGKDTLENKRFYYDHGQVTKILWYSHYCCYENRYLWDKEFRNKQLKALIIYRFASTPVYDSMQVDNDYKNHIYKKLIYNKYEKEWFVEEKVKSKKRKHTVWNTFYHDYHKMYFTTRTTTKYNKCGDVVSEIKYDTYLKQVESKTIYLYEYY